MSADSREPDHGSEPDVIYYELPFFDPGDYLGGSNDPGNQDTWNHELGDPDDGPVPDAGTDKLDSGPLFNVFCRSFDDCDPEQVCNFSLGRCEKRSTWKDASQAVYTFHALESSPGDMLVLDGARFYAGLLGSFQVALSIGGKHVSLDSGLDENRLLAPMTSQFSGPVVVKMEGGVTMAFPDQMVGISPGVVQCNGQTPEPDAPGEHPWDAGPYAAGYLDIPLNRTRVFYPADCGSVRRPAVPGSWPLVVILHGNGAVHISYEYLAQLLATWGFVSVMPATEHNNEYSELAVQQVLDVVYSVWDMDISDLHPALSGVSTTRHIAFIGHSRGCARTQNALDADAELASNVVATVFLGPADDGVEVPGMFMVFGAGHDGQSPKWAVQEAYDRQPPPRWKVFIPGGNHGSFCDHKVYYMFDGQPTITRREQLVIVQTFVLPLLQRAFGLLEPYGDYLDDPPESTLYQVEYELE